MTVSTGKPLNFNLTEGYASILIFAPTNGDLVMYIINANSSSKIIGTGSNVKIDAVNGKITITNNVGWPVRFILLGR